MNEKYTALTREGVIIIIACCVFILDNQCVLYLCMAFLSRTRNLAHELEFAHVWSNVITSQVVYANKTANIQNFNG